MISHPPFGLVLELRPGYHFLCALFVCGKPFEAAAPDSVVRFDKQFLELRNTPLLVLDDLAMQSATPWAREKVLQLIDHRYVAQLPTVVTTAADKSELGARLESRLLDPQLSIICPITAPMYRGGKRKTTHRST